MNREVIVALALVLAAGSAQAADKFGRLTIDVKVEGSKSWQNGQDWSKSVISESYKLVTQNKSDGRLDNVNVKDPQFAQKQLAKGAAVQKRVAQMQGKKVQQPKTQEEYMALQKKMAEDMQKGQAACKGDMNCMMELAQKYSQQSAAILPPQPAGAPPVEDVDLDAEEPEIFLNYFGYAECPASLHIRINNSQEGATADVAGMIPFKQSDTADYKGTDLDRQMQCINANLVYDTQARKIYMDAFGHAGPRGTYKYWDKLHGDTVNNNSEVNGTSGVWEWVMAQLRVANPSGTASTTLPVGDKDKKPGKTESKVTGSVKVTMSWKFEQL